MIDFTKLVRRILPNFARPRAVATPAYDATGGAPRVSGWSPTDRGINDLLYGNLEQLRSKSRDAVRRNPWAANAIEAFVSNSVGTGIVPRVKHPDPAEKRRVQELWLRWTDQADADNLTDFYGLQALACRVSIEAGECLARLRSRRSSDKLVVPLQLQLIEPDHLPLQLVDDRRKQPGNVVRFGIEFDQVGRRVAYHLYRENPNDVAAFFAANEISRVPAASVLHLYKPLRAGQQRGQPWMTPVLATLYDLEKYDVAELVRKKIAAMFVAFEVDSTPEGAEALWGKTDSDAEGVPTEGLSPGTYYQLPYGKDVRFNTPVDVGGMYGEFMRLQLRKIAAGVGVTYEMLTGDLERVNYSSTRAGMLEFRRRCEAFQHQVMVFQFCRPVWRAWVEAAVLSGAIAAEAFAANPNWYLDVDWKPPAWPWVDPLKDVKAETMAIDALLKSRSSVIAASGYDREDVDREIAEDQRSERENEIQRRDAYAIAELGGEVVSGDGDGDEMDDESKRGGLA